jgi:cytochrome c-type protein NapC
MLLVATATFRVLVKTQCARQQTRNGLDHMRTLTPVGIVLAIAAIGLTVVIALCPGMTRQPGGKILALFFFFILPVAVGLLESSFHLERSKQIQFCLSCHVMSDYGRSFYRADLSYLPVAHFQNHLVSPETPCYTCHTDYTMYGDIRAKWRGLRHVYVQYLGKVPQPSEITLYRPYDNQNCLYCHEGARSFDEGVVHTADPAILSAIKSNKLSCLSSGCHDSIHNVATLDRAKFWTPPKP